jgi:hypothetical protein
MTAEERLATTHCVLNDLLALTWVQVRGLSVTRDALVVLGSNAEAYPGLPLTVLFADSARLAAAGAMPSKKEDLR